ncbi:glutamine amidotransferase protein [Rhizobium etli bv. phaseoli str. IE4803]|nr:glutamine amidotransferase protein [Rhizobium etli bv. phaseoli str. IE4803]
MAGKAALVLRHVHFEDLGSFGEPLAGAGYEVLYQDVGESSFLSGDPSAPDLLVVLGGPIAVYEGEKYPFLDDELAFIGRRLDTGRPILGVCLGAQLIARSLGADVFASGVKEIGFSALQLTGEGMEGPLRHLEGVEVLHWHGDTYSLPEQARHLASSELVKQQAFCVGANILGLQFHPEARTDIGFERWLVGHAAELAAAGIDPARLRGDAIRHGPRLRAASIAFMQEWLQGLRHDG